MSELLEVGWDPNHWVAKGVLTAFQFPTPTPYEVKSVAYSTDSKSGPVVRTIFATPEGDIAVIVAVAEAGNFGLGHLADVIQSEFGKLLLEQGKEG